MKPAIASLALAIVFCGHALVRKSLLTFAAPGQGSALFDDESARRGPSAHVTWWGKKMVGGSRTRPETPSQR